MAWISFPNLFPAFFVKDCLFSLAMAVGRPIHLDQATLNKTRPSCARVKVLFDLKRKFPKFVHMKIENKSIGKVRINVVDIQYDYVPQYFFECKMQEHNKEIVESFCNLGTRKLSRPEPTPWTWPAPNDHHKLERTLDLAYITKGKT